MKGYNDALKKVNIRMDQEDVSGEDVIATAKMAHCHEFIKI